MVCGKSGVKKADRVFRSVGFLVILSLKAPSGRELSAKVTEGECVAQKVR